MKHTNVLTVAHLENNYATYDFIQPSNISFFQTNMNNVGQNNIECEIFDIDPTYCNKATTLQLTSLYSLRFSNSHAEKLPELRHR